MRLMRRESSFDRCWRTISLPGLGKHRVDNVCGRSSVNLMPEECRGRGSCTETICGNGYSSSALREGSAVMETEKRKREQTQNVAEQPSKDFLSNGPEIEFSKLLIESYMLNVLDQWARIRNFHLALSLKLTSDLRQVINIPYILIFSPYYPSMR